MQISEILSCEFQASQVYSETCREGGEEEEEGGEEKEKRSQGFHVSS